MKIFYFSGATLPSDSAQSVHVMKMCGALAVAAKGNAVTLFAKSNAAAEDEEIFSYYGVDEVFSLVLSNDPKIPILSGILRLFGHGWAAQESGNPDLAYGRDAIELDALVPDSVPVIFEAHQMPTSFLQKRALKNLIRRRSLLAIVTISETLKEDILKAFPDLKKGKIFVAPDGADVPTAPPVAKEISGRSDALKVGYTGSLHEGKGMEVIAVLAKENPEFDFHVVGGAPAQVKEWQGRGLSGNIFMHGHVPHAELPGYLAAFDILIAPYRSKATIKTGRDIARWISPLKIFEYMAAGKPILCSDLPVLREVLKDGENAILVPPSDIKAWRESLERLKDADLRQRLGTRGFADLEQHYSWERRARNILKFVDKHS